MSDTHQNDPDYLGRAAPEARIHGTTPEARTGAAAATDDTISLLDLLAVIVKRKWLIIVMTAAVAAMTVAFLITTIKLPPDSRWNYLPNKYKPTANVLLQDTSSSSSLSSILSQSNLSALSGLLGAGVSGRSTSADLAQALLRSRTLEDQVAEQFHFVQKYRIVQNPKTTARQMIERSLKVKYDDKSGMLEIGYEDIDPVFATDVTNFVLDSLAEVFGRLTLDRVTARKDSLEKVISQAEKDSADLTQKLIAFQNKYNIYDLPAQVQANIKAIADLTTQLVSKQMDLEVQRKYLPESDSGIAMLKAQIAQLQKQIDDMKMGGGTSDTGIVPMSKIGQISSEYYKIQQDLQTQQAILSVMKQQYETARIEEQDTSRTFQIVEKAEVPEVRSSPSRSKIAIIATLAGFFVAILIAFIAEYFERAKRDPVEAGKLAAIRSSLAIRRKPPLP